MEPTEIYQGWIVQAKRGIYAEVRDACGNRYIPVQGATSEAEAIELAKRWIEERSGQQPDWVKSRRDRPGEENPFDDLPF